MKTRILRFKPIISFLVLVTLLFPIVAQAFVRTYEISAFNPPGFLLGIWTGLMAPYAFVAHFFINDVVVFATPNVGSSYVLGFFVGLVGTVHLGWLCVIVSYIAHISNIQLF